MGHVSWATSCRWRLNEPLAEQVRALSEHWSSAVSHVNIKLHRSLMELASSAIAKGIVSVQPEYSLHPTEQHTNAWHSSPQGSSSHISFIMSMQTSQDPDPSQGMHPSTRWSFWKLCVSRRKAWGVWLVHRSQGNVQYRRFKIRSHVAKPRLAFVRTI